MSFSFSPDHIISKRVFIIVVALVIAALGIAIRLSIIMISGAPSETERQTNRVARGAIVDRNMRVLAINTELDSITAWTPNIDNLPETSALLSEILQLPETEINAMLDGSAGFVLIKRHAALRESERITALRAAGKLNGITLQPISGRIYPAKNIASTVIGYTGTDQHGLGGIEYRFDDYLYVGRDSERPSASSVQLTLDLHIQSYVDAVARDALVTEAADSVVAIVMQAKTGEVLASVSLPNFDPNTFSSYSAEQRRNRTIASIFEPGSVFKIFSISTIIEEGGIGTSDLFDTSAGYRGRGEQYEITDLNDYHAINTTQIIKFSSNIGAALASNTISEGALFQRLSQFGFGKKSGIELSGEETALFRTTNLWTERTKPTIAIGQEIGVTAMQIVSAATAIAGDGRVLTPRIVKQISTENGEHIYTSMPQYRQQPISPQTAATMRRMMHEATQAGGTARRVQVTGVDISAKTGTAEVFDVETNRYSEERFIASCLAIFPTEDPQYIVYFVIDTPRGASIYGGVIAAPHIKTIIEYLISYLGVATRAQTVTLNTEINVPNIPRLPTFDTSVPNLIGFPKIALLPLLEQSSIPIQINGSGWVVRQTPQPNTPITDSTQLILDLE